MSSYLAFNYNWESASPGIVATQLYLTVQIVVTLFGHVLNVDVGLHQGSALSPCLFLILMDVLTEGVRKEVPEYIMCVDNIVLCGGREVDMTEYLDTWRKSLEERGMRVSRPKTQYMDFNFGQNQQGNREPVKILGEELERVTHFKYLGTSMEEEGGMETEITKRVGAGWINWKKCS